jgi:DNA polymerase-3 subunit alpha
MMAIDQDTTIDDPELFVVNSSEQYFKTRYELRATFNLNGYIQIAPIGVFESACNNTLEVADKCESFKPDLSPKLPNIENAEEELVKLALQGLRKKGLDKDKTKYHIDGRDVTYKEQMEIELNRIIEKGFTSYFLITRSLVQCSLKKGYPLGPGRGSASGSLICYLLDISQLDSIKWGLSFDRFQSPARGGYMLDVSLPRKEESKK